MNHQTKDILLKFDETGRYETPSNFDRKHLEFQVKELVRDLESMFGMIFKIDDQVQDASFFADVIVPRELVNDFEPNCLYSIRISNFGNLATFNFESSYSQMVKDTFIDVLQRHRFIFISSDDLEEDYDGTFDKFNHILGGQKPGWRIRYFDYL